MTRTAEIMLITQREANFEAETALAGAASILEMVNTDKFSKTKMIKMRFP
ncbi:MAG: hypothetical protein ACLQPD_22655 [Desulfomonilaceae bacterium]